MPAFFTLDTRFSKIIVSLVVTSLSLWPTTFSSIWL